MTAGGPIEFAGALDVALAGGINPAPCTHYSPFFFASSTAGFDTVTGPDFGGATFDTLYFATKASVQTPGSGCQVNLSTLRNAEAMGSSEIAPAFAAAMAIDGYGDTGWCAEGFDFAPALRVSLDTDRSVDTLSIQSMQPFAFNFVTGRFVARDASEVQVYDSGPVTLVDGTVELDVVPPAIGVRSVSFEGLTWSSATPCIGEFEIFGPAP